MADNSTRVSPPPPSSSSSGGRGFGKILQKSVIRTKEKVLQNLGKADKTRDDDFEQHVQNFNDQQATVEKLQKMLKHYTTCIKEMSVASYCMYKTIKETYEINWTGYTEVASAVEQLSNLWEDYQTKLTEQVTNPLTNYTNRFQDVKKLIAKRGRKLTDYDSARHNHESLCTARRHDETKITKSLDELNEARQVYESIHAKLNEELPGFHTDRIGFLASLFNAIFTAENIFQHESAKLKDSMSEVTLKLCGEANRENKFGIPRSDSDADGTDNNHKQPSVSKKESATVVKPVPNPRTSSSGNETKDSSASSPVKDVDRSPVHGKSQWYHAPESSESSLKKADGENGESKVNISSNALSIDANVIDHYSLLKPIDDIYKIPTSNQLIESLYPDDEVLYKVVATHSYVGDDTDELSFEPGEVISVVPFSDPDDKDEGWLVGIKDSSKEKGVFPENFTKRLE